MSPIPEQFTDRWGPGRSGPSFDNSVCWHLLLGGDSAVRSASAEARRRLDGFRGLHMTPERWLHVTVCLVGPVAAISGEDMDKMLAVAQTELAGVPPAAVTLEKLFYHPQGVVLGISSADALRPVVAAARAAMREVPGAAVDAGRKWTPHLSLCYSTLDQAAGPVAAALGKRLPRCEVTVNELSLVVQNGQSSPGIGTSSALPAS